MGKTHLGVYDALDGVEVTALCDVRPAQMDLASAEPSGNIEVAASGSTLPDAKRYADYEELLGAGGFDAVDVCLPTYLHADYSIRALDAGYHVFCEKPMALCGDEASRVIEAVERSGRLFQVGQCLRFWPAYVEMKRIIDEGDYGATRAASFTRLSNTPRWSWDNWILDPDRSGSAALDLHIHDVDMVRWLFGDPSAVRSRGIIDNGGVSHIATDYAYDSGLLVQATGGWICSDSFGFRMQAMIILERATLELDSTGEHMLVVHPSDGEAAPAALDARDGFYYELSSFTAGVSSGKLSEALTPEDAAAAVRMCRAEIESVETGREIRT